MDNSSPKNKTSRRKFLFWSIGAVGVAAGSAVAIRSSGYPEIKGWKGKVLSSKEAYILMSACAVILPGKLTKAQYLEVAKNADRYIYSLPKDMVKQIHLLFVVVENITFMDFQYKRFTKLSVEERDQYLRQLSKTGGNLKLIYKTLRDFCMLGYYQQAASWKGINYPVPAIPTQRLRNPKYSTLVAAPGVLPKSMLQKPI